MTVDIETGHVNEYSYSWRFLGKRTPHPEISFLAQVFLIYIVVIGAIVNLSIRNGDSNIWVSLLCSALGYMLPSPASQKIRYRQSPGAT